MNVRSSVKTYRRFGLSMGIIFIVTYAYCHLNQSGSSYAYPLLAISAAFFSLGLFAPTTLASLYSVWMKIGDTMGKFVSPLTLGVLFFTLITPLAILMRLLGRDELRLKFSQSTSYWIDRGNSTPPQNSFTQQF